VPFQTPESIEEEVSNLCDRVIRAVALLDDDCGSNSFDRSADFSEFLTRLSAVLARVSLENIHGFSLSFFAAGCKTWNFFYFTTRVQHILSRAICGTAYLCSPYHV
jgi:hypothetical protein